MYMSMYVYVECLLFWVCVETVHVLRYMSFFYIYLFLFIHLTVPGLSCSTFFSHSMWDLAR